MGDIREISQSYRIEAKSHLQNLVHRKKEEPQQQQRHQPPAQQEFHDEVEIHEEAGIDAVPQKLAVPEQFDSDPDHSLDISA